MQASRKRWKAGSQGNKTYNSPSTGKELVDRYCILAIHHRRCPVTPDPPWFDVICPHHTQRSKGYFHPYEWQDFADFLCANGNIDEFYVTAYLLLRMTNPPKMKIISSTNTPKVLATTIVFKIAPRNRNKAIATWCVAKNAINWRKNLFPTEKWTHESWS